MQPNELGQYIRKIREENKLGSLKEFAPKLGISNNTLASYELGKVPPDIDFLINFSDLTGIDIVKLIELRIKDHPSSSVDILLKRLELLDNVVDDLETARSLEQQLATYNAEHPKARDGMVAIALYDIKAVAQPGVPLHEHLPDLMHFNISWLRTEFHAMPHDLMQIHINDRNMEPLKFGDTALIDKRATTPDREGLYILKMGSMLLVKHLQALPGGCIRITSNNQSCEPFTVKFADINGSDFKILGRVVWSGTKY